MSSSSSSPYIPTLMQGKVALITGGGSGTSNAHGPPLITPTKTGIGLGIATQIVKHGGLVCISGRRPGPLEEACNKLGGKTKAVFFPGDVRDPAQCAKMVDHAVQSFGRIDLLVNNAAGNFVTAAEDLSPNALKTVMDIDFHGSFNMAKAALGELAKTKGLIVNISATLYYKCSPFQMHASAAKAAIDVMSNNLGVEWGAEHGVRAVSVAPGPIEGTVGGPTGRVFGDGKRSFNDVSRIVPAGRFGTVDDIAYTVLFLASSAGAFVNATTIVVDGGHWHEASDRFLGGRDVIRQKSLKERQEFKGGVVKAKL
jgi:peroxisomal 2,4-dienoyl-CoA reductase